MCLPPVAMYKMRAAFGTRRARALKMVASVRLKSTGSSPFLGDVGSCKSSFNFNVNLILVDTCSSRRTISLARQRVRITDYSLATPAPP